MSTINNLNLVSSPVNGILDIRELSSINTMKLGGNNIPFLHLKNSTPPTLSAVADVTYPVFVPDEYLLTYAGATNWGSLYQLEDELTTFEDSGVVSDTAPKYKTKVVAVSKGMTLYCIGTAVVSMVIYKCNEDGSNATEYLSTSTSTYTNSNRCTFDFDGYIFLCSNYSTDSFKQIVSQMRLCTKCSYDYFKSLYDASVSNVGNNICNVKSKGWEILTNNRLFPESMMYWFGFGVRSYEANEDDTPKLYIEAEDLLDTTQGIEDIYPDEVSDIDTPYLKQATPKEVDVNYEQEVSDNDVLSKMYANEYCYREDRMYKWECGAVKSLVTAMFRDDADIRSVDLSLFTKLTSVPSNLFRDSGLTKITLPNSIKVINNNAFENTKITEFRVPDSLTNFSGNSAFSSCTSLTAVYVDTLEHWCNITAIYNYMCSPMYYARNLYVNGVLLQGEVTIPLVENIPYYAFERIKNVTRFIIQEGTKQIGVECFAGSSIQRINIPSSIARIYEGSFNSTSSLTRVDVADLKSYCGITFGSTSACPFCGGTADLYINDEKITDLVIPGDATKVSSYVFYKLKTITSVTIPSSIETIGADAFGYCTLLSSVTLNEGLKLINDLAFERDTALTNIAFPSTLETIGTSAFIDDSKLADVTFNEGLLYIYTSAFAYCGMSKITLPSTLTLLGSSCFGHCSKLAEVHLKSSTPCTISANTFNEILSTCQFYIPSGTHDAYYADENWKTLMDTYTFTEE